MLVNAEIKFECSHCGQRLSVDASAAGMEIACPACQTALLVPSEAEAHAESEIEDADPEIDHELIRIREQLVEATMSRGRLERDLAGTLLEVESLQKQLRALGEQRDTLVRSLEESREETQRLASELEGARRELDRVRSRCAGLETEKEVLNRSSGEQQATLEAAKARIAELETSVADLQPKLAAAIKDAGLARKDVETSSNAKKVRRLREDLDSSNAQQTALRDELAQLTEQFADLDRRKGELQQERDGWEERCLAAERKVQALSESKLQKDNTVLRSILERQKVEMEQRFKELKGLRRAQLGLRLTYALFGLGLVALVLMVVPRIKDLSAWFTN